MNTFIGYYFSPPILQLHPKKCFDTLHENKETLHLDFFFFIVLHYLRYLISVIQNQSTLSDRNIFYQGCLTWPLWTWEKTMTLIYLFSNQIFLPAFVFIGLEQGDCCGYENCGKRRVVGLPVLVVKTVSTTSAPHSAAHFWCFSFS